MKYGVKILAQDLPGTEFSDVVSFLLCPESKGGLPAAIPGQGGAVAGWLVRRCGARPAGDSRGGNSV